MEIDGVPNLGSDELNDARDSPISLELSNRFALVKGSFNLLSVYYHVSNPP